MKHFFILFLLTSSTFQVFAQSKTIQTLKDSNRVQFSLYFSPSTLRMLNFQKDSTYDNMIKGVEKLNVFLMRPDDFAKADFFDTVEKLQQENYEEYIIWDGSEYELQVLGKPKTKEIIGIAYYNAQFYIFNLEGTIDLTKLPELYETVTTQSEGEQNGFSIVYDMIKRDEDQRIRREQRRKEWEEKRRKAEEERIAKLKADSLKIDSLQISND